MKRSLLLIILILALFQGTVIGQQKTKRNSMLNKKYYITDFGTGIGLDYGGIGGINLTIYPFSHFGFFGAIGVQFGGSGWQVGVKGYIIAKTPDHGFRIYLKTMYGINAASFDKSISFYDNIQYEGASVGPGFEFRFGQKRKNGLNIDLNYVFQIKEQKYSSYPDVLPVTISIGYHWEF